MSVEKITIDTNILIYAIDADAKERHAMAIQIFEKLIDCDCVLTLQSLCEFFNVVTRKSMLPYKIASERIGELMALFPIVTSKQQTLTMAMDAVIRNNLSFWDAMLWATAQSAGVTILLTEDFQHEQIIKGVRFVNPFLPNNYWSIR